MKVFTAILITIFVLGLLVILQPNCFGDCGYRPARQAKAKTELQNLKSALQMYRIDNRIYPSAEQGFMALVEKPDTEPVPAYWHKGGYMHRLPKDPWGREYYYRRAGNSGGVKLYTLGRDGVTGGKGEDNDILLELEETEFTEEQNVAWIDWIEKKRRRDDPEYAALIVAIETNQKNAQEEVQFLRDLVERYREITTRYPTSLQALSEEISDKHSNSAGLRIPPIKKEWLLDPWGRRYLYRNRGPTGEAEVYTMGADGVEGGTESNQDLRSATSSLAGVFPLRYIDQKRGSSFYSFGKSDRQVNCHVISITKHSATMQTSCILMPRDW